MYVDYGCDGPGADKGSWLNPTACLLNCWTRGDRRADLGPSDSRTEFYVIIIIYNVGYKSYIVVMEELRRYIVVKKARYVVDSVWYAVIWLPERMDMKRKGKEER